MKNFILTFLIIFISTNCYPQSGWFSQFSGTNQDLRGTYFVNSQTGWALGFINTILKTTNGGSTWLSQNSGTNESFLSGFFLNENTGWIAGGHYTNRITIVCKTSNGGQNWLTQYYSPSGGCVMKLSFVNSNTGWAACAYNGRILKTTNGGQNWIVHYTSVNVELQNCFFVNLNTGWVVGKYGYISKTTNGGNSWLTQYCNTTEDLTGLFFQNSNTGYIVGVGGVYLQTTNGGLNWISKPSGSSEWLNALFFINANTGWIVGGAEYGGNSQILETVNGGDNWIFQNSPTTSWLADIMFTNSNTGWAVGRGGVIIKTTNGGTTLPSPPILTSPPNNAVNISVTPTLVWNTSQGATRYRVQISTVANFQVITDSATVSSTQYQVPAGKLLNGYTYFWRVNASNTAGTSGWSSVWSFSTGIYPPAPVLTSPPNGFIGTTTTPTLVWDSLQNVFSYRIEISRIPNFLIIVDSSTVSINQYTVPSGILFDNITYFWRVNARNSFGSGPWSNVWSFTPQPSGVHNINKEIPIEYYLFQNYPNPFNPETKIKFDIPKASTVTITVYDNLGRMISELVNEKLNVGSYEVEWNGSNYPSGIYFYKIITEEFVDVKKLILLK